MTLRQRLIGAFIAVSVAAGLTGWLLIPDRGGARPIASSTETTTTVVETTTTTAPPEPTTTAAPPTTAAAPPGPVVPVIASDPVGLAAQIDRVEALIHDPAAAPDAVRSAAIEQQFAYRALVAHPEWKDQVSQLVRADVRPWLEQEFLAGSRLRSMIKNPKDTMPRWRIVPPAPADELMSHYQAAEAEFGVPWYYLAAINLVETRMGRIRGVSSAGAQGPMQFMPATWAAYGEGDVHSDKDAIRAAARYLKANGAPGDMRNAVWNYNHHNAYVDAVLAHADRMSADPFAFRAYHQWQVIYVTVNGDEWLHEGWENTGG